ncbi:MAG: OmpA family protein [Pikeienuella sp.]
MLHYIKSVAIAVMLSAPAFISAPASAQPVLFYEDAPDVDDLKRELGLKPRTRSIGGGQAKRRQLLNPQSNERFDTPTPQSVVASADPSSGGVTLLGGKWFGSLVQFEKNRAVIRSSQHNILDTIGQLLREEPGVSVIISGHADKSGGDAINRPLSERRAAAVKRFLNQRYGIANKRMRPVGASADQPLAGISEYDPKNRRVQFGFLK